MKNLVYLFIILNFSCLSVSASAQKYPGVVNLTAENINWGLSNEDWLEYKKLMQGEAGLFYANATPYYVLSVYSTDITKKKAFAERDMLAHKKRHLQTVDMYELQNQIAMEKYGAITRKQAKERSRKKNAFSKPYGRFSIFVKGNCVDCDKQVKNIILNNTKGVDIYYVGALNDKEIRHWAAKLGIPHEKVRKKEITLNNGTVIALNNGVVIFPSQYYWVNNTLKKLPKYEN